MKKVLIIFLFLANLFTMAKAETFPGEDWGFTKEKYPIYYSYLNDYAKMLYDKFDGKHVRGIICASWLYTINKDGTISDIKLGLRSHYLFEQKIKKIILKTPPPKFYEGMEIDSIKLDTYFGVNDRDEGSFYNIYYNPHRKEFDLGIHKDSPVKIPK
ncbi:hypothetical protein J6E39_01660 [bacterium]|nr:hypothetical protein [bacterium]